MTYLNLTRIISDEGKLVGTSVRVTLRDIKTFQFKRDCEVSVLKIWNNEKIVGEKTVYFKTGDLITGYLIENTYITSEGEFDSNLFDLYGASGIYKAICTEWIERMETAYIEGRSKLCT